MKKTIRITIIGILFNTILFGLKLTGGMLSGSLALYSDSFNSLTDIIASVAIFIAVRIGTKTADADHPFGHHRAEPIAGLIVAIFASILGFEILRGSFESIFTPRKLEINSFIFIVIGVSVAVKLYLTLLFRVVGRRYNSPALLASAIDHRNDILVSGSVLIGSIFIYFGYHSFDTIVAFLIGAFIVYSGIRIGIGNIDFLMGKVPSSEVIEQMKKIAISVEGVLAINEVKAHYIGNIIQVEIHIEVDKHISTEESHAIAKKVQNGLEKEEIATFAFVHVDPV
jgi:cation diffusion facilitator family transporter